MVRNKLLTSFFFLGLIGLLTFTPNAASRVGGGGSGSQVSSDQEHPLVHQGSDIVVTIGSFNNLLSSSDTDIQAALDTIDNLDGSFTLTTTGTVTTGVHQFGDSSSTSSPSKKKLVSRLQCAIV